MSTPKGSRNDDREGLVRLHDGRALGYLESGPSSSRTLLYFGSSRIEARILFPAAQAQGIRIIGLDRPGIGVSQFQEGRTVLDWPADVTEIADLFGIDRFAVIGLSSGAPFAISCAHTMPRRLIACGIVSGVGPTRVRIYQRFPWLLTQSMRLMGSYFRAKHKAEQAVERFTRAWPEADRIALQSPGIRDIWVDSLLEAFRQGWQGYTYDTLLAEAKPWGFNLGEVTFRSIFLWHGELDKDVPISMATATEAQLLHCRATYYPDQGHISVIVNNGREILRTLFDGTFQP